MPTTASKDLNLARHERAIHTFLGQNPGVRQEYMHKWKYTHQWGLLAQKISESVATYAVGSPTLHGLKFLQHKPWGPNSVAN